MKTIFSIITLFIFTTTLFAQPLVEGRIIFDIKVGKEIDPQMASMMPKEASAWFKKGKSRFEMNLMMGAKNTTITDEATKTSIMLMDAMGMKYVVRNKWDETDADAKKAMEDAKVTVTKETKIIAGYNCNKTIVEFNGKSGKTSKFDIWSTKDLAFTTKGQQGPTSKVEGAALEFTIDQGPISMTLTAREVRKEAVSDDKFIVPTDYKEMSMDELLKMTGGR
jgi:GLPGLI family protein